MRKFIVTTPYGDSYYIHDGGEIQRGDGRNTPSRSWLFRYVARTDGFAFGCRAAVTLADLADGRVPCRFKSSGKPRFTMADLDHGTSRIWGNTQAHGIGSVQWAREFLPGVCAP